MMTHKPVSVQDVEKIALTLLPPPTKDFFASGVGHDETVKNNKTAFKKWYIIPRMLTEASVADLTTTVLGHKVSIPIGVAPTCWHKMAHPEGECATARAAQSIGALFSLSTVASCSIEEVASATPSSLKWFQLYPYKDRDVDAQLIKRAESAGYSAIMLTVDVPVAGNRIADAKNKFALPSNIWFPNFEETDEKSTGMSASDSLNRIHKYVKGMLCDTLTWKYVQWLKSSTHLPIIIKGILSGEDAELCIRHGAAGIVVSNHGGRQLDGAPASIEALPEVVAAVAGRCEVYLDGGVSQGIDVFKALALGARMVFIGRSMLWGLVYNGEAGVRHVLELLTQELMLNMTLAGCNTIADIKPSLLRRVESYSRL